MSLRTRILLILSVVIVIYIGLDYLRQRLLVFPSFILLEQEEAKKNMDRCLEAIENEIEHLDLICADWAAWDDTYQFVVDGNEEYIASNLVETSFYDNYINLFYFTDKEGKVVWGKVIDFEEETALQVPGLPLDALEKTHPLLAFKNDDTPIEDIVIKGIFMTKSGPMLISSRPVITSENEGPIRGYLIMGRFMTDKFIAKLNEQTRVNFQLWSLPGSLIPGKDRTYLSQPIAEKTYVIRAENKDTLSVFTSIADIEGSQAIFLRAEVARDITAKGFAAMRFSSLSIIAIGLIILLALLILIHRGVVGPISALTEHVVRASKSGIWPQDLPVNRKDEIGILAQEFNEMIKQVTKSKHELEELVEGRTAQLLQANTSLLTKIAERKQAVESLQKSEKTLEEQKLALEQKNIALREILEQIEFEKKKIQDDVIKNVNTMIIPLIKRMKRHLGQVSSHDLDMLHNNVETLTSTFATKLTSEIKLSPREIEICNMIKSGSMNKEIAEQLNISLRTVEGHRNTIRRKLGIANQEINLTVYLQKL